MLSVQDIHTYYGDSYILQGVSLELNPGQVVALLGRNGVGKTTLARSIMGLTPAKRGRILFKQIDITRLPAHRIAQLGIGFVPQGRQIFRSLSGERTFGSYGARTGRLEPGRDHGALSEFACPVAQLGRQAQRWRTANASGSAGARR